MTTLIIDAGQNPQLSLWLLSEEGALLAHRSHTLTHLERYDLAEDLVETLSQQDLSLADITRVSVAPGPTRFTLSRHLSLSLNAFSWALQWELEEHQTGTYGTDSYHPQPTVRIEPLYQGIVQVGSQRSDQA